MNISIAWTIDKLDITKPRETGNLKEGSVSYRKGNPDSSANFLDMVDWF